MIDLKIKDKLTLLIPAYKSEKLLVKVLNSITKNIEIIIVDNSNDIILKKFLEKKYKNCKVYLKKNIGYGRAINYGSKFIKTKYFFVMNPDTIIYNDTFKILLSSAEKIKKFGVISPDHIDNKKRKSKKKIVKNETLSGGAMLFKTKIFKKLKGFDNKIFLYYEDNDYFKKCILRGYNIYTVKNCFYFHKKKNSSSAKYKNLDEKNYFKLISGWHGQWSKFYYNKKYYGYFQSLLKIIPKLILIFIQLIINLIIDFQKAKYLYFKLEGLISSIIGLPAFKRSKYDKFI